MKRSVLTGLFIVLTYAVGVAQSHLRVPYFFGSDMVLQRQKPVKIWGSSSAKASFTVEFMGQNKKVKADRVGHWTVEFPAAEAGGPYEMKFNSDSSFVFSNIMIGDVWFCSGQSNMEWKVMQTFNAPYELRSADLPNIRSFTVTRQVSSSPLANTLPSQWQVCTPQHAAYFSAVAYFFAKEIHQREKIPIGIIHASWGGTFIEAWTGLESISPHPDFTALADSFRLRRSTPRSIEAKEKKYSREYDEWKKKIQGLDPGYTGRWFSPEFTPAGWSTLIAPGFWESQGLKDYDGIVWMRKEINVPASLAGKNLLLNLEVIDDYDITWFNGVEIGSMSWAPGRRIYAIPGKLVKEGKNLLAIRIEDNGGNGGFRSRNAADLRLQEVVESDNPLIIPVSGEWLYHSTIVPSHYLPKPEAPGSNRIPSSIYNAMVAPFSSLAVKGILWYQGESNAGRAYQYRSLLPLMIRDWRKQFQRDDLPFLLVQIAAHGALTENPVENSWAALREAQAMTLSVPQTGMVVTIDVGDPYDVHPTNKQVVGKRLAAEARKLVYGEADLQTSPVYRSMQVKGNKVHIQFTNTATGLVTNGKLKGFAIAGADKKFVWADAAIEGREVVVWSDQVQQPVSVRYAWAGSPVESNGANLYNAEGFPASPFRTDDWDGVTKSDVK